MVRLDHIVQQHLRACSAPNASLKVAQKAIRSGAYCVDGTVIREPKRQIIPGVERVTVAVNGEAVACESHVFYLMHKPVGCVCQRHPRESTIYDLVPPELRRADLACVGRLDRDTTGALLLCTDGGLSSMLLFPTSRTWKVYLASCSGQRCGDAEARFQSGLQLEDGTRCAPARLEVLGTSTLGQSEALGTSFSGQLTPSPLTRCRVTVHEGFFHQVKRMLAACGLTVVSLHRELFGFLGVDEMAPGSLRPLSTSEVSQLGELLPPERIAANALEWERRGTAAAPHVASAPTEVVTPAPAEAASLLVDMEAGATDAPHRDQMMAQNTQAALATLPEEACALERPPRNATIVTLPGEVLSLIARAAADADLRAWRTACHALGAVVTNNGSLHVRLQLQAQKAYYEHRQAQIQVLPPDETGRFHATTHPASLVAKRLPTLLRVDLRYSSLKSLPDFCFDGCRSLEEATLPASLIRTGERAFGACTALTSVVLPSHLAEICDRTFADCWNLERIGLLGAPGTLPKSLVRIGVGAFEACCSLEDVVLPPSLNFIGFRAFYGCSSLTAITLPPSLTLVDALAFRDCCSLSSVTHAQPSSLSTLGDRAYAGCGALKSIELPPSLTAIGLSVLEDCRSLKSIRMPESMGLEAFLTRGSATMSLRDLLDYPRADVHVARY